MNIIKKRGFSLVETLVTLAVLGIIAAISYAAIGGVKENTDEQKLRSDVGTLNRAVKVYLASGGSLDEAVWAC